MSIEVSDVDEASSSLQELFDTTDQDGAVCIRHIAPIRLLHLGEDENTTISELYDVILQSWLAPMPSNAPLRVRQHKERLARRIAAEVTMAATRCQLHYPAAESQLGLSQINSLAVPILSSQPLLDSPSKSSQWASSQPLPSPPLTQRSLSEPQSSPQPSPPDALGSADPLVRLSKHLKFKEDSILHTSIPASVEQLLSHWQPGTDPRSYEWDAAERANRTDSLDESSQKMLEKARKRKERREKKQQRENELMRTQSSSQPFTFMKPTAFSRSSPGPMLGGIGSSSQASSQPFTQVPLPGTGFQSSQPGFNPFAVQSQVGPGKYGGRLDKKKKKKNRVSGF
jgi:RNA polymerase I-specific transcription initiation factor RRN6